jgi:hypothetical protein
VQPTAMTGLAQPSARRGRSEDRLRRRPLMAWPRWRVVRSSELARLVSFVLLSLKIVQSVRLPMLSGYRKPA